MRVRGANRRTTVLLDGVEHPDVDRFLRRAPDRRTGLPAGGVRALRAAGFALVLRRRHVSREAPRRGRVPRRPPPHRARAAPRTSPRTLRRLLERSAAAARAGTPPGTRTRSRPALPTAPTPARSCPLRRAEAAWRLRIAIRSDAIRSSISMSIRQNLWRGFRTPARCCFPEACSRSSPCRSCASATRRRTRTKRRAARLRRSRESTAPRSKGLKLKKMRLDALFFPRLPRLPRLPRRAARRRPSRYTAEMALA